MSDVLYESAEGICTITLNRPGKLNAINEAIETGLAAAWRRFNDSDDRVAILAGSGERAFSVGKDFDYDAFPNFRRFVPGFDVVVSKPIIAAVNGWCIGGAMTLVQMCDLCVAGSGTRFMYPEAKLGFAGGIISGLATRIPHKVAMEIMLLGEELSVERAFQVGLVNKVVAPEEVMPAARAYARRLADNAPLVLAMLKDLSRQAMPRAPLEHVSDAMRSIEQVMQSDDYREGFSAVRDKRQPAFKAR